MWEQDWNLQFLGAYRPQVIFASHFILLTRRVIYLLLNFLCLSENEKKFPFVTAYKPQLTWLLKLCHFQLIQEDVKLIPYEIVNSSMAKFSRFYTYKSKSFLIIFWQDPKGKITRQLFCLVAFYCYNDKDRKFKGWSFVEILLFW